MTIIDGDTLKEAYKNAANIDDREKENAYKMIDQQIEAQKEKFDMLVYDPDWTVRRVAARLNCGLDILVNDPSQPVRMEVAKQGYGLDQLVHDPEMFVRIVVARQGYGLDQLINDPVAAVRMEVAMQNYGLMKLIHDPSTVVRDCAEKQLRKRAAEQNLPELKFSRPKTKGKVR